MNQNSSVNKLLQDLKWKQVFVFNRGRFMSVCLHHVCSSAKQRITHRWTFNFRGLHRPQSAVYPNLSVILSLFPSASFTYRAESVYMMLAVCSGGKNSKVFVIKIIQITWWEGSHGYNIQSPLSVHIWRDLCVSTSSSCLNAVCCQIAAV